MDYGLWTNESPFFQEYHASSLLIVTLSRRPCHIVQSFEEHILFEPTRFFEEVEFAKSMSSAQEHEVGVSFGIL